MSKRTLKNHKNSHNTPIVLCWHEKKMKAIRGNGYRFVPKGGTFPTETITLVVRSSGLWEAYTQTCPKWDKKITTACRCHSMIACQVSWISDEFWIYYNLKIIHLNFFAGNQRCPGVWNSFPFLAWDLSMHPRTHIWFFNQFICTGACACSSNLNYAHKCIEISVNA